jgi:hypothetical protein
MAASQTFGHAFKDGFSAYRDSGAFSDVTVITRDGAEYQLHAIILARGSEFMRAALSGEYREASTRRIQLQFDFERHVWEQLLSFLYTDRITLDDGCVIGMLALARQLMVRARAGPRPQASLCSGAALDHTLASHPRRRRCTASTRTA